MKNQEKVLEQILVDGSMEGTSRKNPWKTPGGIPENVPGGTVAEHSGEIPCEALQGNPTEEL